jgi:hypothetical protein
MVQSGMLLRGICRLLYLYDVAESIDLGRLRALLGARGGSAERSFPRRTPEYVRFEQAPVVEPPELVTICPGVDAPCPVKYYEFGAIAVQVELPFEFDEWKSLVDQGAKWIDAPGVEPAVRSLARRRMDNIMPAVSRPAEDWLLESYLVVEIHEIRDKNGAQPLAEELLAAHGGELVQLVRGENVPLAAKSVEEALQISLS